MIAFVTGRVDLVYEDSLILDHQGIGFEIKVPGSVLTQIAGVGSEVKLYTYLYVREDIMDLYGFLSREDLSVFRLLIGISGIGPKAALAVLSTLTVEQLRYAVISDDEKAISQTPGIGPKGARRLIMELKDKLKLEDALDFFGGAQEQPAGNAQNAAANEAALALVSLGYSNSEAVRAVQAIPDADGMPTEQLLREALKILAI